MKTKQEIQQELEAISFQVAERQGRGCENLLKRQKELFNQLTQKNEFK